ncbi:MAG: hypothetical protein A3H28_01795 [Acidobacteria bacterium RIFCSPLOWO2_02_FULL_61_28]|nr:MAG: hypothetical protein A3H28_01795 [Acidobacteria bacterium RIFCSPLOWO2_02_FULL_61_28]
MLQAQEESSPAEKTEGTECTYFTNFPQYSAHGPALLERFLPSEDTYLPSSDIGFRTQAVARSLPAVPDGPPAWSPTWADERLTWVDHYIFSALRAKGIAPANLTNDAEFLRRITLDLTGRIPSTDEVTAFLAGRDPQKRTHAIDRLLDSPEWVDRWTFWFGDLLKNNVRSTQVVRYNEGRNAFNQFIRESLTENKPYNQFVAELITASGDSFETGAVNFNVGGRMTMGPVQDTYDKQWVQVATTFLGLKNFDCLLCHNGAGHLNAVNLWGSQVTRAQAWGLAAFFTRSRITRYTRQPNNSYVLQDVSAGAYNLNTNSGNRPVREPAAGQSRTVTPTYLFSGRRAGNSENYRQVLAQEVTSDFQFARATVNYIWAHFFGVGIVDPPDAFDLARLDPKKPPPEPWTIQPSHPELLDELARFFIAQNYNLKALMREISNSRSYQLSSRYEGKWSPTYTRLLARHLVRRLDSEELHDALVESSGVPNNMRIAGFADPIPWAMQLPDTQTPGGAVGAFLNTFLRGDRDENPRRKDLSVAQSLDLMNDPFVIQRVRASTATGLLARLLATPLSNSDLVEALYLNVLSRHPTAEEKLKAITLLQTGTRRTQAEDLLWSLYNKVDFIFNY